MSIDSQDEVDYSDQDMPFFTEDRNGEQDDNRMVTDNSAQPENHSTVVDVDVAVPDSLKRTSHPAKMNLKDSTPDVTVSHEGRLLGSLLSDSFTFLLSAVRGTLGVKSGSCAFEVRVIEELPRRSQVRVGFGTSETSIFVGDGLESVGFDSEGCFWSERKRNLRVGRRFAKGDTVAVVINGLEISRSADSPPATISLFVNGVRASAPQTLPEEISSKTLYPMVSYNGATLQVNQGRNFQVSPVWLSPLSFSVPLIGECPEEWVEVSPYPRKWDTHVGGGSYTERTVLVPVGLPDCQALYKWVDELHARYPGRYLEISDRAIVDWIRRSGFLAPQRVAPDASIDRPGFVFGINSIDDSSIRKILKSLYGLIGKDLVIVEARRGLIASERKSIISEFGHEWRKVAVVVGSEDGIDSKWPEMSARVISQSFASFSLPSKEEGFDECVFEVSESLAIDRLMSWKKQKKIYEKVDFRPDLDWIKTKNASWLETKLDWRKRQRMWLDLRGKSIDSAGRFDDVWSVDDVNGDAESGGVPLYSNFQIEDWALIGIRFEVHVLLHSFKKDVIDIDPERVGLHKSLLEHYYQLYFGKQLYTPQYGAADVDSLLDLISDSIKVDSGILKPALDLAVPHSTFVRLTEHARRERERSIREGDESAKLKLIAPPIVPAKRPAEDDRRGRTRR